MKTTLNKIRKHSPCPSGWKKLLTYIGKTEADYEPLSLLTILDANGLDDALWCLRAVEGYDREIRLYAVWCARQVQHLLTDKRSLAALDVAERYANGKATKEELAIAGEAAVAYATTAVATDDVAAKSARGAAMAAADAARAAAYAAAYTAAEAAAYTAAEAARDAAWGDARAAARAKQEAELRRICEEVQGESGA